ncbi:antifreeze protein [Sulfitobacter aestuariivivens]|uniref:Antifreeze protein n=1 Tax=Sulfitobacter aestuariivivens TaxID=2766981 RepID=A0A927D6P0_9RHOB|nr:antifreeze protein [Sulfitobacter aestuariivivens]MBD3665914.1 antifreeze protein [Sulfitobacter aestuariivivens]
MTPFHLFALQTTLTTLMVEAQTVIALRLMGLSGVVPARRGENARMVTEKWPAMMHAGIAANQAMLAGKSPDQVMEAGLRPLSRKVRANRKRLMR